MEAYAILQLYTCVMLRQCLRYAKLHEHGMESIIQRALPFDQGFSTTPVHDF